MIACYHAIDPRWSGSPLALRPEVFAAQCAWLARSRRVLDLHDAVDRLDRRGRLPRGLAAITFDDGLACLREHALPILLRHELPATVFLVSRTLADGGHPVDWVDTPPPYSLATLTRDDVLEMQEHGITFGSHTLTHADLPSLEEGECVRDLTESRRELEELLGRPVPLLAYPRGRHSETVRRAARAAGYSHAFSLPQGREPVGAYAVPRVGVYPANGALDFRIKAHPRYLGMRMSPARDLPGGVRADRRRREAA